MSQTVSPSTSRSYGLARVSRAWSVSRAGVYRFLKRTTLPAITRRRGPTGPCPDADLADHIRREIEPSDFHGEGYRKLWARLRVATVRPATNAPPPPSCVGPNSASVRHRRPRGRLRQLWESAPAPLGLQPCINRHFETSGCGSITPARCLS